MPAHSLWAAVDAAEDGSRWTMAAPINPAAAMVSPPRPRLLTAARARHAIPVAAMAASTAGAAGKPGTASRLTVNVHASTSGVRAPATTTSAAATGSATIATAAAVRLTVRPAGR